VMGGAPGTGSRVDPASDVKVIWALVVVNSGSTSMVSLSGGGRVVLRSKILIDSGSEVTTGLGIGERKTTMHTSGSEQVTDALRRVRLAKRHVSRHRHKRECVGQRIGPRLRGPYGIAELVDRYGNGRRACTIGEAQ
jgi:hypothetical protein